MPTRRSGRVFFSFSSGSVLRRLGAQSYTALIPAAFG